jgi:hypothetical protein
MDFRLFSAFLPDDLLIHFDILAFKELGDTQTKKDCFYIYLDEKKTLSAQFNYNQYESK